MATNTFLDTSWIAMEPLALLLNELIVAEQFNTDYDKEFRKEFAVGSTITVKFPQQFNVIEAMGYAPQGINRISTTVSLDTWLQVPFEWDDYEAAVKIERSREELREQYFYPAAQALAQKFDDKAALWGYQNASMMTGVLGTDPTTVNPYYTARRLLRQAPCPPGDKVLCLSSSMVQSLGQNITTVFNPQAEISKLFREMELGPLAGFRPRESNSLFAHTAGTWAGAVTVNGASQSGTSLTVTFTAGDSVNIGDKFSIANVNSVNRMTRRIAGPATAKVFTITTAIASAAGGGADTINFLPAIFGPGSQYQNVDALPANSAALTLWPGTTSPSGKVGTAALALGKKAFAMVSGRLYMPKKVEDGYVQQDKQTGIALRFIKFFDPVRSMQGHRFDSLIGFGNLFQDNDAVVVAGA